MTTAKEAFQNARRTARRKSRREDYRRGLRPMAIAGWNTSKEHNVGTLVRTAHAAAAEEILLVGDREWNVEAAKTADLYTEVTILADESALLDYVALKRWNLVAVELSPRSVSLFDAQYPERPCFLLGAERGGIPAGLLEAAALIVEIPQWGLVPCLNLAVAGSIVMYDYLGKRARAGELNRPEGGLVENENRSVILAG